MAGHTIGNLLITYRYYYHYLIIILYYYRYYYHYLITMPVGDRINRAFVLLLGVAGTIFGQPLS